MEEVDLIVDIIGDKKVLFFDIGANAGNYSLMVAQHAAPNSKIIAFELNPEMLRRLRRNVEMNSVTNIVVREIALGEVKATGSLSVQRHSGNLGQASVSMTGAGELDVQVRPLSQELVHPKAFSVVAMKIDVVGFEASILEPLTCSPEMSVV